MAYAKKTAKNEAYQKLKTDLKEGNPLGNAYLFYGEESYLREYYLGEIRKRLIPAGFEEFNYHALEGKDLTAQSLTEMAEAMPMMAERTLIVVTDWDIYKLSEDQRERFIALLEDLPEYCCIVFVYDTMAYKQNKTVKKLCKAMDAHVTPIEFKAQDTSDLTAWIARRFRALGKQIDRQTAEYLIFLCGGLMTGLSQEIAKIGAYAKGEVITQRDIDGGRPGAVGGDLQNDGCGVPERLQQGCRHFGGPAENAGGAHRDPGGAGEPAAAALHRPDGH